MKKSGAAKASKSPSFSLKTSVSTTGEEMGAVLCSLLALRRLWRGELRKAQEKAGRG